MTDFPGPFPGPPAGWVYVGPLDPVITNRLGGRIDHGVAEVLARGGVFGQHVAWDFHGVVWHNGGRWHERVCVHHKPVGSYSAETLEELQTIVNDEHGWR